MYSGRAGLAALPLDCKEFPEEVVDEVCEGSAGVAGLVLGQGTIIFVVCLLLSSLPVLQFFVLHLAPAQGNLTVTDTLHCTALSNTSYVT